MALTRPKIWDIDTNIEYFMDPITVLHQGSTSANVDVGFLFNRANGLVSNVALYWNESTQSFVTAYTSSDGTTNSNVTVTSYANVTVGNVYTSGLFWAGNSAVIQPGILYTSGNTVPTGAHVGDQWYYQAADTLYEYINDGTQNVWVDIQTSPTSSGVSNAVAGNLTVSGNLFVTSNATAGTTTRVEYNIPHPFLLMGAA